MKYLSILFIVLMSSTVSVLAQADSSKTITSIDFVQVIDNQFEETEYYYRNNWKVLREMAVERGYIHSFQVLQGEATEEAPFYLLLITTYADKEQYDKREEHFRALIEERGKLRLLNELKPADFRKTLFSRTELRRWN